MNTTAALIREAQQATVVALSAASWSNVPFRLYENSEPFESWIASNPAASMRWFYIEDDATYELPMISDGLTEQVETNFTMTVAYPKDNRYNTNNRAAALELIDEDRRLIDGTIGMNGGRNYISGQHGCWVQSSEVDEGENVWLLSLDLYVIFSRPVSIQ